MLLLHQVQCSQLHFQVVRGLQQTHQKTGYSTACKVTKGSLLVATGLEVSTSLSYLASIWYKEASFWIICSFMAFLTPLIFSWLQIVLRSLYFRVLIMNSQTALSSSPTIVRSAQVSSLNSLDGSILSLGLR